MEQWTPKARTIKAHSAKDKVGNPKRARLESGAYALSVRAKVVLLLFRCCCWVTILSFLFPCLRKSILCQLIHCNRRTLLKFGWDDDEKEEEQEDGS